MDYGKKLRKIAADLNEAEEVLEKLFENENRTIVEEEKIFDQRMKVANLKGEQERVYAEHKSKGVRSHRNGAFNLDGSSDLDGVRLERSPRDGEVYALRHGERLADVVPTHLPDGIQPHELSINRYIRGIALGDWRGAEAEQRATGIGGTGTNVVPTPLALGIIDLARNKMRTLEAGARTVPMESNTLKIGKLTSDPTGYWRAEHAAITESDPVFSAVTLTAKTLGVLVRVSVEWLEDAQDGDNLINSAIASALALELDRVTLVGSGSGSEPQGIFGASGVQEIDVSGTITDYTDFTSAVQKLHEKNVEPPFATIMAPRTWATLDGLTATDNQPLMAPKSYQDMDTFVSNQVPITQGGGGASSVFFGGWEDVLVGMRSMVNLQAVPTGESDGTSGAFSQMEVLIRGYIRADVQLARPDHLVRAINITV